jgi:hypothetical protein
MLSPFTLAADLEKSLPNSYRLAPRPDHPYLLQAPSLLIGGEGKTTAIFILGKTASEANLSARVTATRLALPHTARLVALVETTASVPKLKVQRNFDEFFYFEAGMRSLLKFVQSNAKPHANLQDLIAAKRLHSIRWSAATQVTNLRRRFQNSEASAQRLVDKLALADVDAQHQFTSSGRRSLGTFFQGSEIRALPSGRALMPDLRVAWDRGLRSVYTLDEGVPYSNEQTPPSLLLVDSWPDVPIDPEKPFRVAAFSGWVMASPESEQDVYQLVERTQAFFRRKLHERP